MSMKNIGSVLTNSKLTNVQPEDVQPNAVDLRVAMILKIHAAPFEIDEEKKVHRGSFELLPDHEGYWTLEPGDYEVVMENHITVGYNEAGWVITRSTLNRNGVFLTSGLYDTGYDGVMAACLHVGIASMRIKKGTRIGQYLCFDAQALSNYNGDYGVGKAHDAKYVT